MTRGLRPKFDDPSTNQGGETPPLQHPTVGQIVAYFKYQSTKEMNRIETNKAITKFWQRNYYEHIIRDEKDLQNKTDYINANPPLWEEEDNNSRNTIFTQGRSALPHHCQNDKNF